MAYQLSGIAIILFIAFGSLTFILLFIFAKRQIMRFAIKNRHSPHYPVGHGASKSLHKEIERRLDMIDYIRCEPGLLSESMRSLFEDKNFISQISPPHVYRMKVVDDAKELCKFLKADNITRSRHIQEDITQYFIRLHKNNLFRNLSVDVLYKFLVLYEHARYQDEEFTFDHYSQFSDLVQIIKDDVTRSPRKRNVQSAERADERQLERDETARPFLEQTSQSPSRTSNKFTQETSV